MAAKVDKQTCSLKEAHELLGHLNHQSVRGMAKLGLASLVWVQINERKRRKLDEVARKGVFVGIDKVELE